MEQKLLKLKKDLCRDWFFYVILIPGVVLTFIFSYLPMYGVILAFKDYSIRKGILASEWVGLIHFKKLFDIPQFWVAFKNTIIHNVLKLIFCFPIPIILAIMINYIQRTAIKRTVQTILYLPHFVSWVVISGLVFSLLDEGGFIFQILEKAGMGDLNVLADDGAFLGIIIITDIWKEAGWSAIIYLAALLSISTEYYEAARVDGASDFRMFWSITLPLLVPTISIMLILRIGGMVSGDLDQIYNLYNEQVYDVADNLATFSYRYGIGGGNFEIGTAIGLFANIINIILLVLANKITEKMGGEALY